MMMTMMIMMIMIKILHGIRYKWLIENYDDDDTNDDNDDIDDDNDHYSCNSATRSHKAHLLYWCFLYLELCISIYRLFKNSAII